MTLMDLYRPATPGELFQSALRIYRQYWQVWIVLALIALVPPALLSSLVSMSQTDLIDQQQLDEAFNYFEQGQMPPEALVNDLSGQFVRSGVISYAITGLTVIFQAVVLGGTGAILALNAYRGQAVSLGAALSGALGERLVPLVGGHLLVGLVLTLLLFASGLTLLLCVGIVGIGFTIFFYVAWFPLLAPALALERGPLSAVVLRAWHFGKKRVWVLFSAVAGFLIARVALVFLIGLVADLLASLIAPDLIDPLTVIVSVLGSALIAPLEVITYALLYEDSRQQLGGAQASRTAPSVVSAPAEPFLTAADLPNVVGVGLLALVGIFALYCALVAGTAFMLPLGGGL
ncbi:MAG: hypothetical protein JW910_11940 [Anaerolineae bacterium]|nr:hypothetical protein [Anaerolineae bacterium]